MIKVKDGFAKLIGTTYAGSADRVLLSNGGDIGKDVNSTADTIVQRDQFGSIKHTSPSNTWLQAAKGISVAVDIPNIGYYALSRIKSKTGNFTLSCHSANDNKFILGYMKDETATAGTNVLDKTWIFDGDTGILQATRVDATRFVSTIATGTQPYQCTSTTLNTNLNADLLDGYHAEELQGGNVNLLKDTYDKNNKSSKVFQYSSKNKDGIFELTDSSVYLYSDTTYYFSAETDGTWINHDAGVWGVSPESKYCGCWIFKNTNPKSNYINFGLKSGGCKFTVAESGTYCLRINTYSDGVTEVSPKIWNVKITKGVSSKDWTPCPYDLSDFYNVYNKHISAGYKDAFRTQTKGNADSGWYLSVIRCNGAEVDHAPQDSSGIAFGLGDTHGYLYMNYRSAAVYVGAGNQDKLNWVKSIAFADGTGATGTWGISITGNSATATSAGKLSMTSITTYKDINFIGVYGYTNTNNSTDTNDFLYGNSSAAIGWGKDNCKVLIAARSGQTTADVYIRQYYTGWGDWYKLWNEGNDGSGSGLDADLLDGQHGSYYAAASSLANYYKVKGQPYLASDNWDWDNITSFGTYKIQSGKTISNHPLYNETDKEYPYGLAMVIRGSDPDHENRTAQLYIPHSSTGNIPLYVRMQNDGAWNSWKAIPSTSYISAKLRAYLPLAGGTMTGNITVFTGASSRGLKFGESYLNSLNNQLIWQSSAAIRFGSSDWDWNSWAGLKYDHSAKTIYLGLADNTIFKANQAQSGGTLKFPGVHQIVADSNSSTVGVPLVLKNSAWYGGMSTAIDFYNGASYTVPNARIETKMNGDGRAGGTLIFYTQTAHATANPNPNGLTERLRIGNDGRIEIKANTYVYGTGAETFSVDRNSINPTYVRFLNNGTILGYLGIENDGTPVYTNANGSSVCTLLHSGIAYISNGTITINGTSITPLTGQNYVTLNTTQTITGQKIFTNNIELNPYSDSGTYSLVFCERNAEKKFLSCAEGNLKFGSSGDTKKIWHEGNDGANSGLDADLLDGVHASGLLTDLSSGITNKVSLTVGGTTKNITTLYASYLCSVGIVAPQTGRTQAYGDVYSYNTKSEESAVGAPTRYTSVIGFGRGNDGTVEIAGEWTSGRGLWARALRDVSDNWFDWDRILTEATYAKVLDSKYCKIGDLGSYLPLAGGTMTGQIKGSSGGQWRQARDNAIINQTQYASSSYMPSVAMKSASGYWAIGTIGHTLVASYDTDADYSEGNNKNTAIYFPTSGGTLALTSQIPSLTNYYTKAESDSRFYGATISRTANTVLAAPNGSAGVASFRKLVVADMPDGVFKHLGTENKASEWSWGTVSGTSGWNSTASDRGYRGQYGTNLDISGFSTWYHRFAMCTDGRVEYWHGINTKTLTKLGTIAWISDIPTKTSQLTNDSGFITGGPYLPLSGGIMTGAIKSNASIILKAFYGTNEDGTPKEYTTLQNHANGNISLSAASGGLYLGYVNTHTIYCRGSYVNIDSGNWSSYITIPTKTSQLTNDSNFITSRGYIGTTSVQSSQQAQSLSGIINISATGNYTSAVSTSTSLYIKLANKDTSIGLRADAGTIRGVYDYGNSKWLVYSNGTDGLVLQGHVSTSSSWAKPSGGTGGGIKILNTVGSSPTGALSSYSIGLEVSGYYSLQLASNAGVDDTLYFKGASSTGWVEILHKNNLGNTAILYDDGIDTTIKHLGRAGYGYAAEGWKGSGPAIAIGSTNGYTALIQQLASSPTLYVSYKSNGGDVQAWNQIAFISDLTWANITGKPTIPTLYERNIGINGTNWTFSSPYNTETTTIYAPTSAGTSGQVLKSSGGTPTWADQSTLTAGKVSCVEGGVNAERYLVYTSGNNSLYYAKKCTVNYDLGTITASGGFKGKADSATFADTAGIAGYANQAGSADYATTAEKCSHGTFGNAATKSYTSTVSSTSDALITSSGVDTALEKYLPLSGGTMTGTITSSASTIIDTYVGTSQYVILQNHNNGNVSLSARGAGLYLGYYNTNTIYCRGSYVNIDSGNWSQYISVSGGATYSAGVGLSLNGTTFNIDAGDEFPEGTSDFTAGTEILTSYASDTGFTTTNYKGVYRRKASSMYNYIKSNLDSVYLPLTGGTLYNANNMNPLSINSASGESGIKFQIAYANKGWVGYHASYGVGIYNYTRGKYLNYKDDGTLLFEGYTVIHSGNYTNYLTSSGGGGYIGTTAVQSSQNAGQAITGIGSITPNAKTTYNCGTESAHWNSVYTPKVYNTTSATMYIGNTGGVLNLSGTTSGRTVGINIGWGGMYPTSAGKSLGHSQSTNFYWGDIYAGSGNFTVNSTGAYHTSDIRKKTNITKARNLDIADLLVEFDWKESGKHSWGYIAQELNEVLPEAVDYNEDIDMYSVNYNVAHSAAIASLNRRIQELEEKLKEYGIQ